MMRILTEEDMEIGDFFTIEEWKSDVKCGGFIPDDGHGYLIYPNGMIEDRDYGGDREIWDIEGIPVGVLGVLWYNR